MPRDHSSTLRHVDHHNHHDNGRQRSENHRGLTTSSKNLVRYPATKNGANKSTDKRHRGDEAHFYKENPFSVTR